MKTNSFWTIRWKLLSIFLFSGVLTGLTLVLLLMAAVMLRRWYFIHWTLEVLSSTLGAQATIILTGVVLFVGFFFLLSQPLIRYIREITYGLEEIAQGNLSVHLPLRFNDELGQVADGINQMSRRLKASMEEERAAERAKTELITSVSHDLRTPLTSILGYLELIINRLHKDEAALYYCVDIAYQKSQRLNSLIDELFEYTRVSYGGFKAHFQAMDLVELLKQLAEEFVPQLQDADMTCRFTPPSRPVMIQADGGMLVRVFENLFTNAIRYGKEGKYLDLVLIDQDPVQVQVINYGNPISPRDLPYLFERFYRADKSRSLASGGTGLGLAIAKNIVELHGGEITAASDEERGTVFAVTLPKQPPGR